MASSVSCPGSCGSGEPGRSYSISIAVPTFEPRIAGVCALPIALMPSFATRSMVQLYFTGSTICTQGELATSAGASQLRHYTADDSVFIDNEYLIKGVAGRVLWRLLQSYVAEQRVDFTNKEIRLDPTLELPDIKDNLEARLALLRRRLEDRCDFMRIVNTGRGRIRLEVKRELTLREVGESAVP